MEFLARLIGGAGAAQRKANPNNPQQRLARFKKVYGQALHVFHKASAGAPDPVAIDTVRTCLQRLTTLLHDDGRAPAPHLCLSYAASAQVFTTIAKFAIDLANEDVVREAVAWFSALIDSDEENLLENERFAEALVGFVGNVTDSNGFVIGSQTEGEILELTFGIAAKIRLEPELLPVWFTQDESAGAETKRTFPLCYQFIGHVYSEGRAGDFARTGLLYIFESASNSPGLEEWIIESDLPTLMASGLGALYSQLSRKLAIAHPKENLPLILALSDNDKPKRLSSETDSFYSEDLQSQLNTFMSNLVFWQDILEHCRSLEIKETLIDHFQIFFLQQILYPSLLESSDADGGSSVAVLTYLWRILDSVDHPDLIHLILRYLLALTDTLPSRPVTPKSPALEKSRQSLLSLSQIDGAEEKLTPSFFNLVDLILASVQSRNSETVTASLRLISVILDKHHPQAYTSLVRTSTFKSSEMDRNIGALHQDMATMMSLAFDIGCEDGMDESYESSLKDALGLIEAHVCSASRLGLREVSKIQENKNRRATLNEHAIQVDNHFLQSEDPLVQSLVVLLQTFFTNDIETNLSLTNVISHLASCPYTSLEGWLVVDPSFYSYNSAVTKLTENIQEAEQEADRPSSDTEHQLAEEARIGAFKAASRRPTWAEEKNSPILKALMLLSTQLKSVRMEISDLDHYIAGRKRAFRGAIELEQEIPPPPTPIATPRKSGDLSRASSRNREQGAPRANPSSDSAAITPRGRAINNIAEQRGLHPYSPKSPATPTRPMPIRLPRLQTPNDGDRRLSLSPTKAFRTLSPLKASLSANVETVMSSSVRSTSTRRSSGEAEIFERKLQFPPILQKIQDSKSDIVGSEQVEREGETSDVVIKEESIERREASLTHVLTNIVILQEFILELAALIQVRASLLDGEVQFG